MLLDAHPELFLHPSLPAPLVTRRSRLSDRWRQRPDARADQLHRELRHPRRRYALSCCSLLLPTLLCVACARRGGVGGICVWSSWVMLCPWQSWWTRPSNIGLAWTKSGGGAWRARRVGCKLPRHPADVLVGGARPTPDAPRCPSERSRSTNNGGEVTCAS